MSSGFTQLQATLSGNIKRLRLERGLAQERLGLESGVDRTQASKIERCVTNPTLEAIYKIAQALGVPVSELLTDRDDQPERE